MNWLKQLFSSRSENARLSAIQHVLNRRHGGVLKRIDENRELLQLLQDRYPAVLEESPWVEGWLRNQDCFLTDLAEVGDINQHGTSAAFYPRPWPGRPQERLSIDLGNVTSGGRQ